MSSSFYHLFQLLKEAAHTEPTSPAGSEAGLSILRKITAWETRRALPWGPLPFLLGVESSGMAWSPVSLNSDECCFIIIFKSIILIFNSDLLAVGSHSGIYNNLNKS